MKDHPMTKSATANILEAILVLDEFTARDLSEKSAVKINTVRSWLHRDLKAVSPLLKVVGREGRLEKGQPQLMYQKVADAALRIDMRQQNDASSAAKDIDTEYLTESLSYELDKVFEVIASSDGEWRKAQLEEIRESVKFYKELMGRARSSGLAIPAKITSRLAGLEAVVSAAQPDSDSSVGVREGRNQVVARKVKLVRASQLHRMKSSKKIGLVKLRTKRMSKNLWFKQIAAAQLQACMWNRDEADAHTQFICDSAPRLPAVGM